MGILQSQIGQMALWAAAALASLWVLGPFFLFFSPLRKCRTEVRDDPREAEPRGNDPDYARRFAELKALGFTPVGKTVERFRFFTPLHWLWISSGSRWFASPDRKVYVELHRLAGGHPQRMSANTTFEGGGLLVTSTAPLGLGSEIGERYRRVEVGDGSSADELVREHARHLSDFGRDAGIRARPGTLAEMAAEIPHISKPFVSRNRFAGLCLFPMIFLMPLSRLIGAHDRLHRLPSLLPAVLCAFAALFALFRLIALPEFRRIRWLAVAGLAVLGLGLPFLLRLRPRHRYAPRTSVSGNAAPPAAITDHP